MVCTAYTAEYNFVWKNEVPEKLNGISERLDLRKASGQLCYDKNFLEFNLLTFNYVPLWIWNHLNIIQDLWERIKHGISEREP